MNVTNAVPVMRDIPESLNSLGNSLSALEATTSVLADRLQLAMIDSQVADSEKTGTLKRSMSHIGESVDEACDRVIKLNKALCEILDRLQI